MFLVGSRELVITHLFNKNSVHELTSDAFYFLVKAEPTKGRAKHYHLIENATL